MQERMMDDGGMDGMNEQRKDEYNLKKEGSRMEQKKKWMNGQTKDGRMDGWNKQW